MNRVRLKNLPRVSSTVWQV